MAFVLASALMVPTPALALSQAANDEATGAQETAAATVQVSEEDGSSNGEKVTIIVELKQSSGISLFGLGSKTPSHEEAKAEIRQLAAAQSGIDASEGSAGQGSTSGLGLFSEDPAAISSDTTDDDLVGDVRDYYNAFDGFAIKASSELLDDIRSLDYVENAFVESSYAAPVSADTDDTDEGVVANQNSLDATEADQVSYTGAG